jgi:hypothetical protein
MEFNNKLQLKAHNQLPPPLKQHLRKQHPLNKE